MSDRETFQRVLSEVCERNGWRVAGNQVEIALAGDRHRAVRLEFFDFEGRERARLYSELGNAEGIRPLRLTQALGITFGLPHGALALRNDDLVMVDTLPADAPDALELETSLRHLAEQADHFAQTLLGGGGVR